MNQPNILTFIIIYTNYKYGKKYYSSAYGVFTRDVKV